MIVEYRRATKLVTFACSKSLCQFVMEEMFVTFGNEHFICLELLHKLHKLLNRQNLDTEYSTIHHRIYVLCLLLFLITECARDTFLYLVNYFILFPVYNLNLRFQL